ncbi:hypothetical protein ACQ4PT_069456 [Festuca glaucescens]
MARRSRQAPPLLLHLLLGFLLLVHVPSAAPQSFIGINYGDVADNLPPPSSTARLLKSTTIGKVLFADDATLAAQLVPALQNVYDALPPNSSIKVSTVNAMDVLASSDPPSSGAFKPALAAALDPLLAFLSKTGSPFLVNPYPYFAYQDDPRPDTLAFCLFQPNAGRPDAGSGLTYTSMFDAQVDAVRAALDAKGYKDVEVVVAETGWPHSGGADEAGASVENARAFVSGLVSHLRSLVGTPRMPGKSVDTYLFAVYDENLKPGKASEKSFGVFQTTLTETYPTGLMRNGTAGLAPAPAPTPAQKVPPASPPPATPQVTPTPPVQPGAAAASRHTRSAAESSRTFSALHLFACFGFMALLV